MNYPVLRDADLSGKRILLRAGFDVPIENGKVVDTTRIEAVIPTIKFILDAGGSVIIMAHQGRPKGERVAAMSQKPIAEVLEKLLGASVQFADDCAGEKTKQMANALKPGDVLLLENLRFDTREKIVKDDTTLAEELASYADIYVNDAFTNCHRNHTSMTKVAALLPSYMGLTLEQEIKHLSLVLESPKRPITLIISGLKMETKVPVIEQFLKVGDDVLLGGGVANTFIAARGFDVAKSKYEEEWFEKCQEIMLESEKEDMAMVHVPRDVVVASEPTEDAEKIDLPVEDIEGDMAIFDVGSVTVNRYCEVIQQSGTIVWNGPLGFYERDSFSHATKRIAETVSAAAKNGAMTIIGGGDTIDFHNRYDYPLSAYTFVSTGGGAMLEFLSGKELPALAALRK